MNEFLKLGLAIFAVSITLTTSLMFRWLREWVKGQSRVMGMLISCPYCLGHWVALGAVLSDPGGVSGVRAFLVEWMALTGLAGLLSYLWLWLSDD